MRQLPPPSQFGPDEKDVWTTAQKQLRAQGTWTGRSDVPLLEAYCRNVVLARTLRDGVTRSQLETSSGGQLLAAGKLKAAQDAEAAAFRYATALILTPEARKRHNIDTGEKAADELAALVS